MSAGTGTAAWTLLTGHGHVLVAIAKNPRARIRDLARDAGLTERTTQAIIADLEAAGYITRSRVGRRSEYTIHSGQGFRHQSQEGLLVGPFLALLAGSMGSAGVGSGSMVPGSGDASRDGGAGVGEFFDSGLSDGVDSGLGDGLDGLLGNGVRGSEAGVG